MIKTFVAVLAVLVSTIAVVQPSVASGGNGGSSTRAEVRLEARMRSGRTEAKVSYRQENRGTSIRRQLQAEVGRGTPLTTYVVTLNGKVFGTFTTDLLGFGHIEFERNVPALKVGDVVAVGAMKGTLRVR